jgi:hypothetical protein
MFVFCEHLSFVELYIKINTRRATPAVDTFQAAISGYSCEVSTWAIPCVIPIDVSHLYLAVLDFATT